MPGYKTTIKEYRPKLLLTFDGDSFDEFAKTFNAVPTELMDEAENETENVCILTSNTKGYRAGMPGLVQLDRFDQHSLSFGYYGRVGNEWPKAMVEVPHNVNFDFTQNNGSFTVAFWHRVESGTPAYYRSTEPATGATTASLYRPIAKKDGVFQFRHYYPWYGINQLQVWVPAKDNQWLLYDLPGDYWDTDRFIVLTWSATLGPNGEKLCEAKLYVDNSVVVERSWVYYDAFPTTGVPTNMFIGGFPDQMTWHSDRNTSNYQLDQFAVFDYALTSHQIGRLFKKAFSFERLMMVDRPKRIYPFKDPEDPNSYQVEEIVSKATDAVCVGGVTKVSRGVAGPDTVPLSLGTYVHQGGQIVFNDNTGYQSWQGLSSSNDYTLSVYFMVDSRQPGVLLTNAARTYPFVGLTVLVNTFDNNHQAGAVQIQESAEEFASVGGDYTDGKWHHLACVKRGSNMELWLDGKLAVSKAVNRRTAPTSTMTLFGALPGRQSANGAVSYLATYSKALQEQQIAAFSSYTKIFRVRGQVTLRGIPIDAWVKFYSTFNGELITSLYSHPVTGEYQVDLYDNRKVDIVVNRPEDPTIRYRVYGPVTPSEYADPNTD